MLFGPPETSVLKSRRKTFARLEHHREFLCAHIKGESMVNRSLVVVLMCLDSLFKKKPKKTKTGKISDFKCICVRIAEALIREMDCYV